MPATAPARVPGAAWPAAELGPAVADLLVPGPSRRPDGVDRQVAGLDDALWTAVSQLPANAVLPRCRPGGSPGQSGDDD
ncbi:hypothetical protein [Amycolatopsis sp. lyj-23]|uniref:hypothetical protein n=1 Tax=Amycolatopsis sp. lyj-23 TaxID=2789283 RepID=UPI00397C0A09